MKIRATTLLVALAGILAVPIVINAKRLSAVQTQLDAAGTTFGQTKRDASRILELRSKQQTIAERKRPDQDLIARVNAVLGDAGIPVDRFGGLRPESDAALPASASESILCRRQTIRVSLNELTLSQIGEFVSRWSATHPLWILSRIELTHSRSEKNSNRYNVSLLLSAIYVADSVQPTPEHP
jgi:hypothetical protein